MTARLLRLAPLVVVLLALASGSARAADPVKIGYLGPQTGIFAPAGKDMLEGLEMALEQGGYQAGGRKLLAALRTASETTPDPRGPIEFDDYGNPTENVYIVKVEKVGGKLQNTVVHTYPMVSQFWTYKPEEFLKMPAYDRGYPPVK